MEIILNTTKYNWQHTKRYWKLFYIANTIHIYILSSWHGIIWLQSCPRRIWPSIGIQRATIWLAESGVPSLLLQHTHRLIHVSLHRFSRRWLVNTLQQLYTGVWKLQVVAILFESIDIWQVHSSQSIYSHFDFKFRRRVHIWTKEWQRRYPIMRYPRPSKI